MKILPSKHLGSHMVIPIEGDIESAHIHEFDRQLRSLVMQPAKFYVLDFVNAQRIHTACLITLLKIQQNVEISGGRIVLCRLPHEFQFILQLIKLDKNFIFQPSLAFISQHPQHKIKVMPGQEPEASEESDLPNSRPVIYNVH